MCALTTRIYNIGRIRASAKVERWKIFLSEYDYSIDYIKGEDNGVADALSRMECVQEGQVVPTFPQVVDVTSKAVVQVVITQPPARPFNIHDSDIELVHGRTAGHFGIHETLRQRSRGLSWHNMRADVTSYIQSCVICQRLRKDSTKSHGSNFSVSVEEPNKRIAIDSVGPLDMDSKGYKYILVFIDCMSRYVELLPTRTVSAEECAEKLLEYYGRNGAPEELLSDNHKEFTNEIVKTFLRYTGTKPINSIPYSHEDIAIVERVIEEVRRHLAALRLDFESTIAWSVQLPIVQYLLNNHVNQTTGVRPRDIKFGLYTGKDTDLFDK
jgi:hypothetical protein